MHHFAVPYVISFLLQINALFEYFREPTAILILYTPEMNMTSGNG